MTILTHELIRSKTCDRTDPSFLVESQWPQRLRSIHRFGRSQYLNGQRPGEDVETCLALHTHISRGALR